MYDRNYIERTTDFCDDREEFWTKDEMTVLTRETQALFHKNGSWQQTAHGRGWKNSPGP